MALLKRFNSGDPCHLRYTSWDFALFVDSYRETGGTVRTSIGKVYLNTILWKGSGALYPDLEVSSILCL